MGVFLLLMELCKDLERIMCRYWWKNGAERDRGIHWLSWERMTKENLKGGWAFEIYMNLIWPWLGSKDGG